MCESVRDSWLDGNVNDLLVSISEFQCYCPGRELKNEKSGGIPVTQTNTARCIMPNVVPEYFSDRIACLSAQCFLRISHFGRPVITNFSHTTERLIILGFCVIPISSS